MGRSLGLRSTGVLVRGCSWDVFLSTGCKATAASRLASIHLELFGLYPFCIKLLLDLSFFPSNFDFLGKNCYLFFNVLLLHSYLKNIVFKRQRNLENDLFKCRNVKRDIVEIHKMGCARVEISQPILYLELFRKEKWSLVCKFLK